MKEIHEELVRAEETTHQQNTSGKEILSLKEAATYIGVSYSHLYKLTSKRKIPCYCPQGKLLYFKRSELDEWLLRNRRDTQEEISQKADLYLIQSRRRKA